MLIVIQRFGKHCSCHLQGECLEVGCFLNSYIGQAVGGEYDLMVLIGGALYKASENTQPLHIHLEDGNCNVCRNLR
jgi:hypothetical protein